MNKTTRSVGVTISGTGGNGTRTPNPIPARMPRPDGRGNEIKGVTQAQMDEPGPPATPDPGHQTRRESSPARATIALARCPLQLGNGSVSNSHRPSSKGTFRVDAPGRTLFTRWIEA